MNRVEIRQDIPILDRDSFAILHVVAAAAPCLPSSLVFRDSKAGSRFHENRAPWDIDNNLVIVLDTIEACPLLFVFTFTSRADSTSNRVACIVMKGQALELERLHA